MQFNHKFTVVIFVNAGEEFHISHFGVFNAKFTNKRLNIHIDVIEQLP